MLGLCFIFGFCCNNSFCNRLYVIIKNARDFVQLSVVNNGEKIVTLISVSIESRQLYTVAGSNSCRPEEIYKQFTTNSDMRLL